MKFSILTCSYNNREGVDASIEAVRSQHLPRGARGSEAQEIEHIIIDGGSTDGTVDALRAWELEDACPSCRSETARGRPARIATQSVAGGWEMEESPTSNFKLPLAAGAAYGQTTPAPKAPTPNSQLPSSNYAMKWISEPDQGLYDALNKGLRMATGDVIGILHTDDVWEEGVLERVWHALRAGDGRWELGDGGGSEASLECACPSRRSETARGREERIERSCCFGGEEAKLREGTDKCESPTSNPDHRRGVGKLPTSNFYADGVYGDLLYVDAADITKVRRVWKSGEYDPKKWYNGWMPPHPALFVTRELAERVGEYRLDLGSAADYEWMLRAGLVHGAKLMHIDEAERQKGSARVFLTFFLSKFSRRKNVKNHGLTPFVRMRVGGQSNVSVKGRLKAHGADRRAWEVNGLKPHPWTLKMKVIRKIPQWVAAKLRRNAGGTK